MRILAVVFILFLVACTRVNPDKTSQKNDRQLITELMAKQEMAWNNGDLTSFMLPYWQNDSLIFIGKRGPTYGWDRTLKNYKESYPDKTAMGTLEFENISFKTLSTDYLWLVGKWTLLRTQDTLSGHYTLLWHKRNGEWKIIADHSS